jgi:hypothetical protein
MRTLKSIWMGLAVASLATAAVLAATSTGAPRTPEEVVRAYTEAANEGDLEKFLAQYAPGIRKYRFPGELASEGIEHNRKVYTKAFASYPDLRVEILELIALDEMVVVHDRVTGRPDGKTADEITVYEVQDGLITNIVYVKQSVR